MKKLLGLLTALLTLSLVSLAQTKASKIVGTVADEERPIQKATVYLLNSADSSLVKVSLSDARGNFEFEGIKQGTYLVSATSVGFKRTYSGAFTFSGNSLSVPGLILKQESKDLQEVTVVARKPLIEQKIDRTVVNVEGSVTSAGNTALEVLEKAPGVSVDNDGNISLKGKQGVIVMLDGRQMYLSGADLASLLRNMNANQLESIEIMTNPPAKYDAAGNSGIINIKTKKNKRFGYNGSISLGYGQGKYSRFNESFNFNYRNSKVNVFTTLSHNYRDGYQNLDIQRNFREKDTKQLVSYFDQRARMLHKNQSYSAKLGADYFVSKKTTIGVMVSGFNNPEEDINNNTTNISDASLNPLSQTRAYSDYDQKWKNFSGNLNFRHVFDTTKKELSADFDYLHYNSTNDQILVNSYFDPSGNPTFVPDTLLGNLPQEISIYSGKADYLHPFKNGARIEAGVKSSYVKTDNNAQYDSLINGEKIRDIGRSNYFIYEENINAAYINFSTPLGKKWNTQLGLRAENTNAKGNQVTTGETFDRHYTQLFPTAFIQYKLNEKNQFGLNYGRRIQRPDYQSLNPFIYFLDRYTFQQGNPNLEPQFSHNIELSHTYGGFLTTTLNYTKTTDIIAETLQQNENTNETYVKTNNIAKQRQYGISVSAYKQIMKWWSGNVYANLYNNRYDGVINNTPVTLSTTTLELNMQQQFKFKNGWSAEAGGFYRSLGYFGVFRVEPFGLVNLGLSKEVLKSKGSIRLNVRDVLYTQKIHGTSKYSNIDVAFQNNRDSRVVNLNFTYRFNKGKMNGNGSRRRTGGAGDEQSRVKTGGD